MPNRAAAAVVAVILGLAAPGAGPAAPAGDPLECVVQRCAAEPVFTQWEPAQRLRYGYGMTGRDALAAEWYRRSAEAGDARAMHNYGLMLARGDGLPADPARGRAWLARAMEHGIAEAAIALGEMARAGESGPPAPGRARAYYRFAAEAGLARGMHALGNMHALGLGGPKSLETAFFWYYLAAARGHALAARARDVAAVRLPVQLRRDAERRAEDWWRERSD